MQGALQRIADNPFYVLGLRPSAERAEVEREGQKLLGMLELGLSSARVYPTPVGEQIRTADKVRRAMAELRDPDQRLVHELWARLLPERVLDGADDFDPLSSVAGGSGASSSGPSAEWPEVLDALGWRSR